MLLHGAAAPRALFELAGAAPAAEGRASAGPDLPKTPQTQTCGPVRACAGLQPACEKSLLNRQRVSFFQDPVAAHSVLQKALGLKGGLPKASREQAPGGTGGSRDMSHMLRVLQGYRFIEGVLFEELGFFFLLAVRTWTRVDAVWPLMQTFVHFRPLPEPRLVPLSRAWRIGVLERLGHLHQMGSYRCRSLIHRRSRYIRSRSQTAALYILSKLPTCIVLLEERLPDSGLFGLARLVRRPGVASDRARALSPSESPVCFSKLGVPF